MERLKQVQDVINSIPVQVLSVGAVGSTVWWIDTLDMSIKIGSAIYIFLLIATVGFKLIKSIKEYRNNP